MVIPRYLNALCLKKLEMHLLCVQPYTGHFSLLAILEILPNFLHIVSQGPFILGQNPRQSFPTLDPPSFRTLLGFIKTELSSYGAG